MGAVAASLTGTGLADAATPHPDAVLLTAIAEFDDLEQKIDASYLTIPNEDDGDQWRAPLQARQEDLLDMITTLRAITMDGLFARARSLALWDSGTFDNDGHWDTGMRVALLRDLLGPEEVARIQGPREARRSALLAE